MTIGKVQLVVHTGKPHAAEVAGEVTRSLQDHGLDIVEAEPDLVLSLGGDGTMLRAARIAHAADAPLLGINLGTLGYLTETDAANAGAALDAVLAGSYRIEQRLMLACETETGESFVGLNEVLVERAARHRLLRLVVRIGGESLAAFNADGVIVATPTGSTAYALSAGGPIVSPKAHCLVLAPVNPHMIFSRPFVLAEDETVEILLAEKPDGEEVEASVTLDGAIGCVISSGTTVTVRRHERALCLMRLEGPGFVERLRSKLGLPG